MFAFWILTTFKNARFWKTRAGAAKVRFELKLRVEFVPLGMSFGCMGKVEKACPIVVRLHNGRREVLAFTHPSAGNQFVKGTIETGESTLEAAVRELWEESGIRADTPLISLGFRSIGANHQPWHFFKYLSSGLPQTWPHQTEDDFGHSFTFFWHPLDKPLDQQWHSIFHEAFEFFAPLCLVD